MACCSYVRPQKCDIFEERDESVISGGKVHGVTPEATGAPGTRWNRTQHVLLCAISLSEQSATL